MTKFGLIGYPLTHSFSQKYFKRKFKVEKISNCEYKNFPLKNIDELPNLIKNTPNLKGLNVTIPFKKLVIPYLDDIHIVAKQIGAVNTIKIERENNNIKLIGYNTDVYGFRQSLVRKMENKHSLALILGTGGASKAIEYVLKNMNIKYLLVSREKKDNGITYSEISREKIQQHTLIINTTPLGMFPNTENYPDIPYKYITNKHFLYDLIYNPEKTAFLIKGKKKHAKIYNGLRMLELQADMAWEIFMFDFLTF